MLRPVIKGCVRYESLLDGTVGLYDIALLNEALTVVAANEIKAQRTQQQQ